MSASKQDFTIRSEVDEEHVRIVLAGRIGVEQAQELRASALEALSTGRPIDVDGTDAEYMDTAALQVLAALAQEVEVSGGTLRLAIGSGPVRDSIDIAGLAGLLPAE